MKPTGFEDYVAEGPIRPEEYLRDRGEYDPDISFASRIETAITHFCARRKMHQQTRKIFDKFMVFGGMACGQRQFIGGLDEKSMEEYTKKELAELTSNYGVAERVMDGLHESEFGGAVTWEVDFAAVARGFLSSQFMRHFHWYDLQMVQTATNVLRNFYNYLLLHDVCPEYGVQLVAARKVCDDAEAELPMLKEVDQGLPGGFNVACSTLFGGRYSNLYAAGNDWARADDNLGWSQVNADCVFKAGIFAHGTEAQLRQVEEAAEQGSNSFKVISSEELGLEITRVEVANAEASTVYNSTALQNTFIRPMGKLHCKRWAAPHAAPSDLLPSSKPGPEEFEFLVDDDLLQYCVPGMKMECCVKKLDLGVKWIDHIAAVYASFFTWLANEEICEWKEPGPPKEWMVRVMNRDNGVLVEGDGGIGEEREEGELDELD
ncbi:Argonaute complex, subunit Arb1 [Neohortaea acidophila]|uniref:Argonaute complex, subunit Arb1 n=1 Tax=Neohortaea acidophila TaxID=245834 RepID=A0A6A6PTV8_9PEZI|nr:Argonaute complex, subunit Arb1 [Neohortaea acidophila]KAF2483196.1 Argonaute complex, subunit Arb1 [Neohortaea acidophila]